MDSPPNYPVIVVHTDDGNGLTACTGQPMPGPAGDVYRNVPRYFCQACARVRGGGISADVLAAVRTLPGVEEVTLFGPLLVPARHDPQYDVEIEAGRYLVVPLSEEKR